MYDSKKPELFCLQQNNALLIWCQTYFCTDRIRHKAYRDFTDRQQNTRSKHNQIQIDSVFKESKPKRPSKETRTFKLQSQNPGDFYSQAREFAVTEGAASDHAR
jgi:hypothetical protein